MQSLNLKAFNSVCNQNTRLALPFPGKFPTRWRVSFRAGSRIGKRILNYTGKPNSIIASQVVSLSHAKGWIWMHEFDRGGTVREFNGACPRFELLPTNECAALCGLYYPSLAPAAPVLSPWIRSRPRLVRMDLFGREWGAYLSVGYSNEQWEDYAKWVRDMKFQWKK